MITRRRFLTLCGGMIASAFLTACMSDSADPEVDSVTVGAADVPPEGDDPFHSDEGRFFLIRNDDGVLALFSKCTHQGCTVDWKAEEQVFHCPCHGSRFDRHGEKIEGPAIRPLDLMAITVQDGGALVVDTTTITERQQWSPDQSTQID